MISRTSSWSERAQLKMIYSLLTYIWSQEISQWCPTDSRDDPNQRGTLLCYKPGLLQSTLLSPIHLR